MGTTKRSSFASYEIALERATARLGVIAQTRGPLGFAAAWLLASGARALFPREGLLAWGLLAFPVMMTVVSLGWALVRLAKLELAVQEPPRQHQIAETQQGMALVLFGIYGLLAPLWW